MFAETITYPAAFIAGLLSFLSPCILPLIPAYFSFITGLSLDELTQSKKQTRKKVILSTLSYVAGFSFIFILLGASASFLGGFASQYSWIVRYLGGGIILIFGLHLLGIINIKGFNFEKKIHIKEKPLHLMGTFVIGMAFGAGWSPCIGPLLGSILIVAGNQDTVLEGVILLAVYSAGLAIPFIAISIFINSILEFMKRATRFIGVLNKISGILLILIGLLLIFDKLTFLAIL
ncbi:MAG: cytochrome c biogenesis protein CcdA [Desulfobacula sp.]|nr:cytochrome c biogenesis protein CcdA [Desulfobacula sp.]MBT3484372.1 cytochrome c biogenesis protein CcdA [Desulfobacula sp.]MBT3806698.1 cytochrome c biogenesis protein CcdA [Desulfobacula sp.]MBT4024181.1 cytochrome c biogenesis protein CcdA [Desulfobacula sp.]MBT4197410.1 cytochrome c biogenesis protein CcdA [Desulfobacula sp.]